MNFPVNLLTVSCHYLIPETLLAHIDFFDSSLTSLSFMLLACWQCDHQNTESITIFDQGWSKTGQAFHRLYFLIEKVCFMTLLGQK